MASSLGPGRARVVFDEVLWAEDLERASAAARETAHQTRQRLECDGQAVAELLALRPDGPLGLPNCAKVYLPPPKGKWGVVLRFAMDGAERLYLVYLAFGLRHPPKDSARWSVYELAYSRLHGRVPRRGG